MNVIDVQNDGEGGGWRGAKVRRWLGYVVAVGLLVWWIVMAVGGGGGEGGADWEKLFSADWRGLAGVLGCVVIQFLCCGLVFYVISGPFEVGEGKLGVTGMQAMIAGSALLNYVPLRAGLLGRVAYLKRQHGIGYRASIWILILVSGVSVVVLGVMFVVSLLIVDGDTGLLVMGMLLGVGPMFAEGMIGLGKGGDVKRKRMISGVLQGLMYRFVETMVVAARLYFVFAIVGIEIGSREAVILATSGMFITMVGVTPNGLGLREWLYGLIAASGFFGGDVESGLALGLTAGLVDRAAETLVTVPAGLVGLAWLKRLMARRNGVVKSGFDSIHEEEGDGEVDHNG